MTTIEKYTLGRAAERIEVLKQALSALPEKADDSLHQQLYRSSHSMIAWLEFLLAPVPGAMTPEGEVVYLPPDGTALPKDLMERVALIANSAEAAASKLTTKADDAMRNKYKWADTQLVYMQKPIVAVWWDWYP